MAAQLGRQAPDERGEYPVQAWFRVGAAEHRDLVPQHEQLAKDVWRLGNLRWYALTSMLKTLTAKYQSTVSKMAAKYQAKTLTRHGLPLVRDKDAVLIDRVPKPAPHPRKELLHRLLTRRCELCGDPGKVLVHQVRKLSSLGQAGPGQPEWAALMATKRRQTLAVCAACHDPSMLTLSLPLPRHRSPESHVR